MGLRLATSVSALFFVMSAAGAFAAPKLRLSTTAVGPVVVAQGGSANAPGVDFSNAGDGNLNLSATSSVSWINSTVSGSKIQMSLAAGSLARGTYTGFVSVKDPSAVDAPQTISVTMQVGSSVPDKADFFLAPNGSSAQIDFTSGSRLNSSVTTQGGLPFLSLGGAGSFSFTFPYQITATHLSGMAEGNYTGSIVTSGSSFAADNKTIPVTLKITSQPIAKLSTTVPTVFRLAQGSPAQVQYAVVSNSGLGTLAITGATATTASAGNWLSAATIPGFSGVSITADPANVMPGSYQGTVTIAANAANAPITIPVLFDVFAPEAPLTYFQGAVNNSAIERGDVLAKGTIVALFGEQFTLGAPQQGTFPLNTDLAGTKVFVNDQPAPIFYSSYNQINFQIPYDVVAGDALIRVDRSGQRGNSISVTIAESAPRILKLGIGNYAIVVNLDGSLPIPQTAGIPSHPAKAGDALVIYAIGLGQTTPSVTAGTAAPASTLAVAPAVTKVLFGGGLFLGDPISVTPFFVGLTPGFAGLYQINVVVPAGLLPGDVALVLSGPNGIVSKTSAIAVQ